MLNEYQLQFLTYAQKVGARFLIVGGQARYIYHGTRTRDLDIWLDWEGESRAGAEQLLVGWSELHPLHTFPPLARPLPLSPGKQLKFPDADVGYVGSGGEAKEIGVEDGIDILTSLEGMEFGPCLNRAAVRQVGGMSLSFLGGQDLALSEQLRPSHS